MLVLYPRDDLEPLDRPLGRLGPRAQLPGAAEDLRAVAPLESDAAAHPGDGIDDHS